MHLVVGLGNPGRRYASTRHNVGFRVVERLAERWGIAADGKELGSLTGHGSIRHQRAVLVRPQSWMNRSGHPVASILGYYKRGVGDVVVVHDELDLPFGQVRLKVGGGHGGHNGLRDLIKHIGRDFVRVRVGIGRPPQGWDPADYVLAKWTSPESTALPGVVDTASDAVEQILVDGAEVAMNRVNALPPAGAGAPSPYHQGAP